MAQSMSVTITSLFIFVALITIIGLQIATFIDVHDLSAAQPANAHDALDGNPSMDGNPSSDFVQANSLSVKDGLTLPVVFAYYCAAVGLPCVFRPMAMIGGRMLLIDSGSSSLAFSNPPTAVSNIQKNVYNGDKRLALCNAYGGAPLTSHGCEGPTNRGDFELTSGITMKQVVYANMEVSNGGLANWAGGAGVAGTRGTQLPLEGIWGIGAKGMNHLVDYDEINVDSWKAANPDGIEPNGIQCIKPLNQCKCPETVMFAADSLMAALSIQLKGNEAWGLRWSSGKLGATGEMIFGADALLDETQHPKVELIYTPSGLQPNKVYYSTTMRSISFDDGTTVSTNKQCIFDTGTPSAILPSPVFDWLNNATGASSVTVTFNLPSSTSTQAEVPLELTFPPVYIKAIQKIKATKFGSEYQSALGTLGLGEEGEEPTVCIFGIGLMRFMEQITADFSGPKPFFQAKYRDLTITDPYDTLMIQQD